MHILGDLSETILDAFLEREEWKRHSFTTFAFTFGVLTEVIVNFFMEKYSLREICPALPMATLSVTTLALMVAILADFFQLSKEERAKPHLRLINGGLALVSFLSVIFCIFFTFQYL